MRLRSKRNNRAFTLIELLVVIAIIAVLIAILLPQLGKVRRKANTTKCMASVRGMGMSLQYYVTDYKRMMSFTGNPPDSWTQVLKQYGQIDKLRLCPEAATANNDNLAQQPWWGSTHSAWGNSSETNTTAGPALVSSFGLNGWLYNVNPASAIGTIGGGAPNSYTVPLQTAESQVPAFADCVWRHVLPKPGDAPVSTGGGALGTLEDPSPNDLVNHPISKLIMNRHDKAINVSFLDGHASTTKLPDLYGLAWYRNWKPPTTIPPIPKQ